MTRFLKLFFCFFLIFAFFSAFFGPEIFADIYRWKDKDGQWHYSDQPPPESQEDTWWDQKGEVLHSTQPEAEKDEEPEKQADKAPAAPAPSGMLWSIKASGVAKNYILGTIHSEDPRILNFSPDVESALKSADTFIMEVILDGSALMELGTSMMLMDGRTLQSLVGERVYSRLSEVMIGYGIPELALNQMKPWAVFSLLNMPRPRTGQFMDLVLHQKAMEQGKQIVGLETAGEQLSVLDNLPMQDQIVLLKESLNNLGQIPIMLEELTQAYLDGDIERIEKLAEKYMTLENQAVADNFMRKLNQDRNYKMVDRMLPYLLEGNTFVAVGALHLPGKEGILRLLQERGFKISPVHSES